MREVEVKFQVADEAAVLARLAELGCELEPPIFQDDLAFEGPPTSDGKRCILRIRTTEQGSILTLKKDLTNELDCLEIETAVTDPVATKRLLEEMDYRPSIQIRKQRQRGKLEEWEICFDRVEKLGTFLEVETLIPDDQPGDHAQDELFAAVVERLQLTDATRVMSGYDTLLRRAGQVYIEDKQ